MPPLVPVDATSKDREGVPHVLLSACRLSLAFQQLQYRHSAHLVPSVHACLHAAGQPAIPTFDGLISVPLYLFRAASIQ